MISIEFASGKITAATSQAIPDATAGQKKAGVHLTKGYTSPDASPPTRKFEPPVELTGEVDVRADTQAEVDQVLNGPWFFGFIQVARIKDMSAQWEGRRKGEGSVSLLVAGFPVSNDIVALDSDPVNQPFFDRSPHVGTARRPQPGQRRLVNIRTSIGDHPNYRDFLVTDNSLTKARNFLHRMSFAIDFTSVFVGRNGIGPIQPIAHLQWQIDLQGKFKWINGTAKAVKQLASIKVGASRTGAPTEAAVRAIVERPSPLLAKGILIDRWKAALVNQRMRQESKERSLLVPADFFQ
jgi:hypothetical protein